MPTRNDPPFAQPRVTFSQEDIEAAAERMRRVLETGRMSKGPETDELVGRIQDIAGRRAVTVATGGCALWVALTALRNGREGTILLPDIAHWSDYAAAKLAGWRVMWAPVDETGQLDIPHVMEADPDVDAILYVATGGYLSPRLAEFEAWCGHVDLLTDMSHAIGSERDGRAALSFGTVSIASLFATKIVTGGEGGVVTSDDPALMDRVASLRDGGRARPGWADEYDALSVNCRMSDLHAALANVHLISLERRLRQRRVLARAYSRYLGNLAVPYDGSSLYKYLITVPDRATFLTRLQDVTPAAGVWDLPIWRQPGYPGGEPFRLGSPSPSLRWASEHVALPMHESMTVDDAEFIAIRVLEAVL